MWCTGRRMPTLLLTILTSIDIYAVSSAPHNTGKPVIVVVPAAWHSAIHYTLYTEQLRDFGYTIVSKRLPSCNSPNPGAQSVAVDAAFVREELLLPSINAGKEVVVIMHSYSGGPGAVAAEDLSIAQRRAAGRPGGIIGLIFISAFLALEGQTFVTGSGGVLPPWVIEHPNGQMSVKDPKEVFYNGVPGPIADWAVNNLRDQAQLTAFTPCGSPAWAEPFYNGRRAFARTSLDKAIPPFAQDAMLQASGVEWDVHTFAAGHAPFLSQTRQLSAWTKGQIHKFQAFRTRTDIATA